AKVAQNCWLVLDSNGVYSIEQGVVTLRVITSAGHRLAAGGNGRVYSAFYDNASSAYFELARLDLLPGVLHYSWTPLSTTVLNGSGSVPIVASKTRIWVVDLAGNLYSVLRDAPL